MNALHINSRLLPFLVCLALVMQLLSPAKTWTVLLVMLGGAWLGGYLWSRSLLGGLQLERELRYGWVQVGDRLHQRFTLTNRGWAPALWVEVIDQSNLSDRPLTTVRSVGNHSTSRWTAERICERRGLYTLGPTTLQTGDPLGIYTVHIHHPQQAGLMVMPPVVPLSAIEIAPGGRAGEGRRLRPAALEVTVNAAGVRDYQPGEPLSHIHWPTSARHAALFVRQFDSTPSSDWWIYLDLFADVQVGSGWDSTEEHGVMLAASLADQGLREGRAVGLVAHGESLAWLPPANGPAQRLEILRTLAALTPGELPLAELLARARPHFTRGASLVLITPDQSDAWLPPLIQAQKLGVMPTVLLFEPRSFGGELTGAAAHLLDRLGIRNYRIPRELLDRPEARPGTQGAWEWKVLGTGRAIPIRKPAEQEWRQVS